MGWSTNPEPTYLDLITQTVYDAAGRRVKTTDPAGRTTGFTYDLADRLVAVTENQHNGTCIAAPCNVMTRYVYDRAGNRIAIVDARGNVRRFTYDAAGRQKTAVDPLGRTTTWWYDQAGRLVDFEDPRPGRYQTYYIVLARIFCPVVKQTEDKRPGAKDHPWRPVGGGEGEISQNSSAGPAAGTSRRLR